MKNQNSIRSDIEYISRFFQHKGSRYILLVLNDERMLNYLIVSIQIELKKSKKEIVNLKLSNEEDEFSVYNQVKKFLGHTTCDGLIITNLNALIYKNSLQTIDLLNKSRDAFERFDLSMVFVVNSDNLKKIIHGAPDFYQLRELPDYHARGTGIWEPIPSDMPGIEHTGFADLNLKAELLEEQLKIATEKDKIDKDLLNSLVIPLLKIYIDMSFYNKMKPLFNRYIKGREGDIKDRQVLDAYYGKMSEVEKYSFLPGKPIYKYLGKKVEPPPLKDEVTPLDLERLLHSLSKAQLRLLTAAAIYRIPVKKEALLAHKVSIKPDDLGKLKDLSLLEYLKDDDMYYVHPLTAQYLLGKIRKDTRQRYHCRAAEYFDSIVYDDGKKDINDGIEVRWHYLQAGEWDRAAAVTFFLEYYLELYGFPQQALELLKEVEEKNLNEKNRSGVLHQMGTLYHGFGNHDAALTRYQKSMQIREKIGDIKGVSSSLHQIGRIYQYKGEYDAALTRYQKSMEMAEKIGDIVGTAICKYNIGELFFEQKQFERALKLFCHVYLVFAKVGSPYARQAAAYIARVGEKLPEERYVEILGEFQLTPDLFGKGEKEGGR